MALEKAKITAVGNSSQTTTEVDVLFNPTEYSLESSNQYSWQAVPGLSQPIAQFVKGETTTLSMELFFDTFGQDLDVRTYTEKIVQMLDIEKDIHAPRICVFEWGSLNFTGVLESVKQNFTMFNQDGQPVRARLNVTFKSVNSMTEQLKNIPRQSADRTKQRTVKQGDQLWQIAAEEYEDPALWRAIAKANDLEDPRQLEPGMLLRIPRLYG